MTVYLRRQIHSSKKYNMSSQSKSNTKILLGLFLAVQTSGALTNATLSRHQIEILLGVCISYSTLNSVERTLWKDG